LQNNCDKQFASKGGKKFSTGVKQRLVSGPPFSPCVEAREITASGQPPPASAVPFSGFSPPPCTSFLEKGGYAGDIHKKATNKGSLPLAFSAAISSVS
jgi:hypothetical protein